MILFYESSNGNTFDLKVSKIRTRTANLHDYEWTPMSVPQKYGEKVYGFEKAAVSYTMLLSIFGSHEDRKMQLNALHEAFDHDIRTMTPGKLTHGDSQIECYITFSTTYPDVDDDTKNEISVYCFNPFWVRPHEYRLQIIPDPADNPDAYPWLDYPHGYLYDYQAHLSGFVMADNPGQGDADYKMIIRGPVIDPVIVIGDAQIGVVGRIGASEYVVIDSRNKTVVKYSGDIAKNIFNDRIKGERSMFEKIPSGNHVVMWSGSFDCDLTIYEERSEPLWI